jgi:hypothetical protein
MNTDEIGLKFHDAPETSLVYTRLTSDYTSTEHFAVDNRGRVFTRIRARGPRGYANSAWRLTGLAGIPDDARHSGRSCRLPR